MQHLSVSNFCHVSQLSVSVFPRCFNSRRVLKSLLKLDTGLTPWIWTESKGESQIKTVMLDCYLWRVPRKTSAQEGWLVPRCSSAVPSLQTAQLTPPDGHAWCPHLSRPHCWTGTVVFLPYMSLTLSAKRWRFLKVFSRREPGRNQLEGALWDSAFCE